MKNIAKTALIMCVLFLSVSSCKKSVLSPPSNTWTFKSSTLHMGEDQVSQNQIEFTSSDGTSQLIFNFHGNAMPTSSATYQTLPLTYTYPASNQVSMILDDYSNQSQYGQYIPSISNTANVQVNVLSNGKIRVQGSGIGMVNRNGNDSIQLSFDVQQQ